MFIKNLGRIVNSETDISRLVITGDWNTTLHRIDKSGGRPWKPTKYRDAILDLMDELNLVDIFRTLNSTKKAFTYESSVLNLKSRIDYFLLS